MELNETFNREYAKSVRNFLDNQDNNISFSDIENFTREDIKELFLDSSWYEVGHILKGCILAPSLMEINSKVNWIV